MVTVCILLSNEISCDSKQIRVDLYKLNFEYFDLRQDTFGHVSSISLLVLCILRDPHFHLRRTGYNIYGHAEFMYSPPHAKEDFDYNTQCSYRTSRMDIREVLFVLNQFCMSSFGLFLGSAKIQAILVSLHILRN